MTLTVSYHVACDSCEVDDSPGRFVTTEIEARANLAARGWLFTVDGMAICETCQSEPAGA